MHISIFISLQMRKKTTKQTMKLLIHKIATQCINTDKQICQLQQLLSFLFFLALIKYLQINH